MFQRHYGQLLYGGAPDASSNVLSPILSMFDDYGIGWWLHVTPNLYMTLVANTTTRIVGGIVKNLCFNVIKDYKI
jgi:hypothetical protein